LFFSPGVEINNRSILISARPDLWQYSFLYPLPDDDSFVLFEALKSTDKKPATPGSDKILEVKYAKANLSGKKRRHPFHASFLVDALASKKRKHDFLSGHPAKRIRFNDPRGLTQMSLMPQMQAFGQQIIQTPNGPVIYMPRQMPRAQHVMLPGGQIVQMQHTQAQLQYAQLAQAQAQAQQAQLMQHPLLLQQQAQMLQIARRNQHLQYLQATAGYPAQQLSQAQQQQLQHAQQLQQLMPQRAQQIAQQQLLQANATATAHLRPKMEQPLTNNPELLQRART